MTCDHVGLLLLPDLTFLRYIGRIAMPIFAYFIAEGCLRTRSRSKYLLQMFAMATVCQLFYIGEALIGGQINSVYLNILFTFSLSIIVASAYLRLADTVQNKDKEGLIRDIAFFVAALCLSILCCTSLSWVFGIPITVDYGIVGVLLPLSALLFNDRRVNFLCFCAGTLVYCIMRSFTLWYVWFALLALPLLALYNGQRGSKKLKWAFYLFYPIHLAVIYGIDLFL